MRKERPVYEDPNNNPASHLHTLTSNDVPENYRQDARAHLLHTIASGEGDPTVVLMCALYFTIAHDRSALEVLEVARKQWPRYDVWLVHAFECMLGAWGAMQELPALSAVSGAIQLGNAARIGAAMENDDGGMMTDVTWKDIEGETEGGLI
jgi:hypothetical protein